ncbi:MAG: hypothetical protein AAF668_13965 [Pseudomonadota bacterium]
MNLYVPFVAALLFAPASLADIVLLVPDTTIPSLTSLQIYQEEFDDFVTYDVTADYQFDTTLDSFSWLSTDDFPIDTNRAFWLRLNNNENLIFGPLQAPFEFASVDVDIANQQISFDNFIAGQFTYPSTANPVPEPAAAAALVLLTPLLSMRPSSRLLA